MFSFTNKKVIGVLSSEVHCSKSMEKSEVIQKKVICTLRWSENIKYTIYFINIFLYFTNLYIIIYFFLIFAQNIDCGYTLEPPR